MIMLDTNVLSEVMRPKPEKFISLPRAAWERGCTAMRCEPQRGTSAFPRSAWERENLPCTSEGIAAFRGQGKGGATQRLLADRRQDEVGHTP